MSDSTITIEGIDLLRKLAEREGKDAYKTLGRAALVSHGEVAMVRPLEHKGLIAIDHSTAPVLSSYERGEAWAVFTDAGREALATASQSERS